MSADLRQHVAAALRDIGQKAGAEVMRRPLVVAVSGGADSLALLDILCHLLPGEQLIVAHLDHGLRPSSAAEAAAVVALAEARGLRCHVARDDVAALAAEQRLSLEAAGRDARYAFLARVVRFEGAAAVLTGHNADDQAETILMHLLRGAGPAGLRGMSPAAPLPGQPDLWLLRPLLEVPRADIEAYCREMSLAPFTDDSNADTSFLRNRLRHELLPALERYNPQIRARLRETAAVLAAEDDLLAEWEAFAWHSVALSDSDPVRLDRAAWLALPLALRRRLLRRAVAHSVAHSVAHGRPAGDTPGFQTLEAARLVAERGATGARASLGSNLFLYVVYEHLEIGASTSGGAGDWPQLPDDETHSLSVPGSIALPGWRLTAEPVAAPHLAAITANADPWTAFVAVDAGEPLFVRPRRPGERLRPLGLGGERKLQDVMTDRKIPAAARRRWPLVATAAHPLWLPGHLLDDRARVRPDSPLVVRLRCERVTDH